MEPVVSARVFANSSDIDIFGLKYSNAAVRSLFFTGDLIFAMSEAAPSGRIFIASFGAAIIHDVVTIMPTGEEVANCLRSRYPTLWTADKIPKIEFDPRNIASRSLQTAFADADNVGDLYLLVAKSDK